VYVSAQPSILTTLPYAQFKRDPHFYAKHDTIYLLVFGLASAGLVLSGYEAPVREWQWWVPLLLLPGTYLMIMAHVFAHNASHGNFPKPINRIVGELVGILVVAKFASWEIVHRRHHRYSDDPVKDPHPAERGYWSFAKNTLIKVEQQLRQEYFDVHGSGPDQLRYENFRSVFSFISGTAIFVFFFFLFGPILFFVVYVPAFVFAGLFVIHFNWSGHNAHTKDGTIEPTNLDDGWFWIGNRLFFGIYYHGNHHRMARAFNPMKVPAPRASSEPADAIAAEVPAE
jgi:fatty acid desaturase